MARFTNQAQLTYHNRITNSNVAVSEILEVLSAAKHAVNSNYEPYKVLTCNQSCKFQLLCIKRTYRYGRLGFLFL